MKKSLRGIRTIVALLMAFFVWGCVANNGPVSPIPAFTPHVFSSAQYSSAVDNFLVIIDASSSMGENYMGHKKFTIAKEIVNRMNQTLPEMGQKCGLRSFGHNRKLSYKNTLLLDGMTTYSTDKFQAGLDKLTVPGGTSPLYKALNAAGQDLASLAGTKAVIIVSDAKDMAKGTLDSAKALKAKFGSSLCIYTVLVGDDAEGMALMKKIAETGRCGFFAKADDLLTSAGMAKYVDDVFLSKHSLVKKIAPPVHVNKDSDHDGVYDAMDNCPDTPENVSVDEKGCPFDSDNDGVPDYKDKCPDTPNGAPVNFQGCWALSHVLFDTNKYEIKPGALAEINASISVLKKNPAMKILIEGNTDNVGSRKYNKILSVKRAEAVKNYLVKMGIAENRLTTEGFGFSRPVATNKTEQGRALNRRVELHMVR